MCQRAEEARTAWLSGAGDEGYEEGALLQRSTVIWEMMKLQEPDNREIRMSLCYLSVITTTCIAVILGLADCTAVLSSRDSLTIYVAVQVGPEFSLPLLRWQLKDPYNGNIWSALYLHQELPSIFGSIRK
jgi:hypothetical protein